MAIVLLIHNDSVSLWDQDEAAYAGFAEQMLSTGNWLVPDYPWSKIHRKPPLHFWNIAISAKVFGMNEFSTRFPSALFVFLTLVFLYKGTRAFLDEKTAFLSSFILGTSLFVLSLAKISVTDGTLLFFSTVCAVLLIGQLYKPDWKNVLFFWLSFALALLVKGPPIIIFIGFLAVLLFIFHPDRKKLLSFHPWFFLPLALLPLFAWGYAAWQTDNGTFITWMIDWYILKRVGGSVLGQSAPFGSHLLFILVSFGPYLLLLPFLWKAMVQQVKARDYHWIALILWFIGGWFLYELTPSKLPAYTVAAHVPLSILFAKVLLEWAQTRPRIGWLIGQGVFAGLFIVALPVAGFILGLGTTFYVSSVLLSLVLAALLIYALRQLWRNNDYKPYLAYNILFVAALWIIIYPQIDVFKNSPKRVAELLEDAQNKQSVVIANAKGHPPSLVFYLDQVFDEVRFEEDANALMEIARSGQYSLVLNQKQFEAIDQSIGGIEPETVCAHFTDRKGKVCYYVITN